MPTAKAKLRRVSKTHLEFTTPTGQSHKLPFN